jgi:hypothetical protein
MMYRVQDSDGREHDLKGVDGISRDGDWLMVNKMTEQMEPRKISHPEQVATVETPGRPAYTETIMVSSGRMAQTPVAMFHKPVSVRLIPEQVTEAKQEPTNGDNA